MVEKYLWANLTTLLATYDANDNLVQRFEYADQRMPVSMTHNGTKYYLHYDQIGSLRAVTDTSGNIVKEVSYDSYGNIVSDSNEAFKVPFGFAGGLYDSDTKLTRFGYRDYDAYTGKWTAKDPIDFDGGDSNLYGYVLGDPVNFVDPEGLETYNCKTPLQAAPVTWGLPYMYHQYSCVKINGKLICGGQDAISPPYSSGKPSQDKYVPGKCRKRQSNSCFENCLIEKWTQQRPYYGLVGPGTNCQEYDDDVNNDCWKKCKGKK